MKKNHLNASPYYIGVNTYEHRGKNINTLFNVDEFDKLVQDYENRYSLITAKIPKQAEHRPDLISNVFYSNVNNWWLLLLVNNENDPFEFFNEGDEFLLPRGE